MNRIYKKRRLCFISAFTAAALVLSPLQYVQAAEPENTVFINEVESDDANGGNDWIEIINAGTTDVDISGWFVSDDKGLERLTDSSTWRIAENTVLKPGEVLVLEDAIAFDFGLGKNDEANLYNQDGERLDTYSWEKHADGTYARVPDGTGEFSDQAPTKGELNSTAEGGETVEGNQSEEGGNAEQSEGILVINEINSSPDDWVEVMNIGEGEMDISGYEIRDNSDDHRWKFPEGSIIKAGELLLVKDNSVGQIYNEGGFWIWSWQRRSGFIIQ